MCATPTANSERAHLSGREGMVRLSKSKVAAFEHCPRRLWLQVYRPELGRYDEATLRLFECGHRIGELARLKYRGGILVAEDHHHVLAAIAKTHQLVNASLQRPIFEAAFQRERVVIRADVLEPDGRGGWRLLEVKNSAGVKPYQLLDVATQTWVLRGNQISISSVFIRHPVQPLRPWARWTAGTRFVDADVTAEVQQLVLQRKSVVDEAKTMLKAGEPPILPGRHCTRPFRCEFRGHCGSARPLGPNEADQRL